MEGVRIWYFCQCIIDRIELTAGERTAVYKALKKIKTSRKVSQASDQRVCASEAETSTHRSCKGEWTRTLVPI